MTILKLNNEIKLKQLELIDATEIFNLINNERNYLETWLPFIKYTQQLSDTENFVSSVVNVAPENFEYVFVIQKNNKTIGLIGFKDTDKQNKKTEIGYWISQYQQKQGIVTNAVQVLCNFAFTKLDINRIQIKCAVENTPSKNIPKRLDFKLEGIERDGELLSNGNFTDLEIYSLLKTEFKFKFI